jgi:monoamine oxidase
MTHATDVIVVGAGLAGLAAAATLRRRGLSALVLEASPRAGGRAYTSHPPELAGAWFDHGAMWLHAAERNPLVPLARAAGISLVNSDTFRTERTFLDGRPISAAENDAYDATWPAFTATAERILAADPAAPLAAVAAAMPHHPWAHSVENWEGPVINVADPDKFALADWHANVLEGANLLIPGGIGAFAESVLAPMAGEIRLNCPVRAIDWHAPGGVAVSTPAGTLRARAAIVTVSTGVLASGAIRFTPALPAEVQEDLAALPMGLALKVVFRPTAPGRLGLPDHCSLDRMVRPGEGPAMVFSCWPTGRDFLSGWIGGSRAWELDRAGDAAIEDFARAELARSLGHGAVRGLAFALVTRWGRDPRYLGAYAYARPGLVAARARLQAPLAEGRLILAGEACNSDGLAGTVAGAWNSGVRAAGAVPG